MARYGECITYNDEFRVDQIIESHCSTREIIEIKLGFCNTKVLVCMMFFFSFFLCVCVNYDYTDLVLAKIITTIFGILLFFVNTKYSFEHFLQSVEYLNNKLNDENGQLNCCTEPKIIAAQLL